MKKICLISFWGNFDYNNNAITNLLKKYNIEFKISQIDEADILFVGSFVNEKDYDFVLNFKNIKILWISEPIDVMYKYTYKLFKENIFNLVFGCIENNISMGYYKYPLYILYAYNQYENNEFENINNQMDLIDLENKKFCTLINSHDKFDTRKNMYNQLKQISYIDCPGQLFNNCSNTELNSIGNVKFINKYLFNLCPENTKCEFNGYITEKLMNCCLASTIPIYFGPFDEIDEKIFNKERIIFFNPYSTESIIKTSIFVSNLYADKIALKNFYDKKIFNNSTYDTIKNLELEL